MPFSKWRGILAARFSATKMLANIIVPGRTALAFFDIDRTNPLRLAAPSVRTANDALAGVNGGVISCQRGGVKAGHLGSRRLELLEKPSGPKAAQRH
jgi:hypothetical protein